MVAIAASLEAGPGADPDAVCITSGYRRETGYAVVPSKSQRDNTWRLDMKQSSRRTRWLAVTLGSGAVAAVTTGAVLLGGQGVGTAVGDAGTDPVAAAQGTSHAADIYEALLRYHLTHDLPVADEDWNGVLYLPSSSRQDADDPMADAFVPGDTEISRDVQERVADQLQDVADVRWVEDPDDAGLERLDPTTPCHPRPSAVLVWLPPVMEGTDPYDLGISSWAGCGVAAGGSYVVEADDGDWAVTAAKLTWIT